MSLTLGSIWNKPNNNNIKRTPINPKPVITNVLIKKNPERYDNKSYWGTPTWYLFHGIAANINENFYNKNASIILDFIKKVCSNLPCPYCRSHAVNYMANIYLINLQTREKFELMLFEFHNSVNRRIGKAIFQKERLKKYKTMSMVRCFNLFQSKFFKSYYGDRTFSYWVRKKFEDYFLVFSKQIIKYF